MYIKTFPKGKGRGSGPVDYATSKIDPKTKEPRDVEPVVLKGDPEQTRRLIDSIDREWKYTSGVMSWAPGETVTPEQEQQAIKEFEALAFAGLDQSQYDILWVRHGHASHHELHYIIPRLELETGKALNVMPPGWQRDFDPLRDKLNYEHGWSRPDDPELRRVREFTPDWMKGTKKEELRQAAADYLVAEIAAGRVTDRQTLKQSLQAAGVEIVKEGKNYVTILDEEGTRHRLKGGIYEADWTYQQSISDELEREATAKSPEELERVRLENAERVTELQREIDQICARRGEYHHQRYQKNEQSHSLSGGENRERDRESLAEAQETAAGLALDSDRRDSEHIFDGVERDPQPALDQSLHREGFSEQTASGREHEPGAGHGPELGSDVFRGPDGQIHHFTPRPVISNGVHCGKRNEKSSEDRQKLSKKEADEFKQKLIQRIIKSSERVELWQVKYVDIEQNIIRFNNGGQLLVSENQFEAQGMSDALAAHRIVAAAQAANWQDVQLWGSDDFVKRAAALALEKGMEPSARDKHQIKLIEQVRKEHTQNDELRKAAEQSLERNARTALKANAVFTAASQELERACADANRPLQQASENIEYRMRRHMDNELEQFKRLNLADYAVSQGYTLNKQKSSKNALCYDHANGDRVIIGTDAKSGHGVYYSVRDDQDNGTIIDFIQKRQGLNLGQARKELRPWIGKGPRERPEIQPQPKPEPTTRDRAEQLRGLAACEQVAGQHKYLQSRGISPRTLDHFKERVFTDARGNAIFPHYDQAGVSGLEIKNREFTGFSKGGEKGLWFHGPKDPERIVVCESAIDCMSHYQIHKPKQTMYVSTAGKMSQEAKQNLKSLLDRNDQAQVVAAFDNDKDGQKFGQELAEIAGREVKNGLPKEKDWNEQLKKEQELELERKRARDREYEHELRHGM